MYFEFWEMAGEMLDETHVLIAGCTGSGKSVVLAGIIHALTAFNPAKKSFYGIDLKRVELQNYSGFPHCYTIAKNPKDALTVLKTVEKEMNRRFAVMENRHVLKWPGGDLYLIIDELADLTFTLGADAEKVITRIMRLGRAAKVHVIAATQAPQRKVLTSAIMQNFSAALALRCKSDIESRQIIGIKGAELLPRYGVGIYSSADGFQKIKIPYTGPEMIAERLQAWKSLHKKPGILTKFKNWIKK